MNTVFLICGATASGKDCIANNLETNGYKVLKSYATRPRRANEGNTHIFINENEVDKYDDRMIAYTKIGDYSYFATREQLDDCDIYIIDYEGIKYLKTKVSDVRFITIFINVPYGERMDRVRKRGDIPNEAHRRLVAEEEQFTELKVNCAFDYSVCNIDLKKASDIVQFIIKRELV